MMGLEGPTGPLGYPGCNGTQVKYKSRIIQLVIESVCKCTCILFFPMYRHTLESILKCNFRLLSATCIRMPS